MEQQSHFLMCIVMMVMFLASCQDVPVQVEPTNTPAPLSTPLPEPKFTPKPTRTPLPTDTSVPTATNTPSPTATITPTPTPQAGETRINPETGHEEVFSNAFGWEESYKLGTVIVEDGGVKVMTEQGLLPFSEQIVDRLETDRVDVKTTEVVVAGVFIQIGNILSQINSTSDQVIYGKESQIFRSSEQLIETFNNEPVIRSQYGIGIQIWDDLAHEWIEPIPGTLAQVAPQAVRVDDTQAYDGNGLLVAVYDDENEMWYGTDTSFEEQTVKNIQAFLMGELQVAPTELLQENGVTRGINYLRERQVIWMHGATSLVEIYDLDDDLVATDEYTSYRITTAPMVLGYTTTEAGELVVLLGAIDRHGSRFVFGSNSGYFLRPLFKYYSRLNSFVRRGDNPSLNDDSYHGGYLQNAAVAHIIPDAVGRNSHLEFAFEESKDDFAFMMSNVGKIRFGGIDYHEVESFLRYFRPDAYTALKSAYNGAGGIDFAISDPEQAKSLVDELRKGSLLIPHISFAIISADETESASTP